MRTGMLWFDNHDHRDLKTKIMRAVIYYESKYGQRPSLCYVHPAMLVDGVPVIEGLQIKPSSTVLHHHFWLGIAEEGGRRRPAA